ncbi:MAG: calcium-binding protein, partial [Thermodesulfovibrionales bacterium]
DLLRGYGGNDTLNGGAGNDSMTGGAGNDTYYVNSSGDIVTENAGEGTDTVRSSVSYALGENVEKLILTGTSDISGTGNSLNNAITGNSGNNFLNGGDGKDSLSGGGGNDTLYGGTGADTMKGGAGDDTYYLDNSSDKVTENLNEGSDTVNSSLSFVLGANVENLTLTGSSNLNGTGNDLNNVITGNSGNNILTGGGGNDTLNGQGGADTMTGGAGDDTYYLDNTGDAVTENPGEGADTVVSSITCTLGANVENLLLSGTAYIDGTGNNLDNTIYGNMGNNVLSGGVGNDTILGGAGDDTLVGGTGNDAMAGGLGNDAYSVDTISDVVTENAGEGSDTIVSPFSYTLGANTENLFLDATTNINGTGNDLDNYMVGNSGNNILSGGAGNDSLDGGAGNDTMKGGAGDDAYGVDSSTDVVTENAGEGTDTVNSSITFTLGANLENLVLTGTSGLTGTGNSLDNQLVGNSGSNTLTGGAGSDLLYGNEGNDTLSGGDGNDGLSGGGGSDVMLGGAGDDTYVVDASGDLVTESLGAGTDTVLSSISCSLGLNVEDLGLLGTADINGTGNSLDNQLAGNSGNNILKGNAGDDELNGGAGNDTMAGGTGNDTYVVDSTGDLVSEGFSSGTDTVLSSITYTLGSNVENLALASTADLSGTGNSLNNVIIGNTGNNALSGGTGNDTILGGSGNDLLIGGTGSDTFMYGSAGDGLDTIADFTKGSGNDLLDLTSLGITADADHLRFSYSGGNTTVSVDTDGGVDTFVAIAVLQGVSMTLADTSNYDV